MKDLLASALDRESDDREAFLEEACAEDASLRQEVETLLASDEAAELLERPAFEVEGAEVPILPPGTRLGPYEVVALLAAGGMGEVYRARDARLGREVAVKVLPRAFSEDRERLRRFEHEARAASALNHPNVVVIFDVGSTGDLHYAVSELLDGETLRARLAGSPLAVRDALRLARDVVTGLRAVHERGIVHRDLKPENVFVTRDGRVKILDFGLAKQMGPGPPDASAATLRTHPGMVLGTVGYMSPEQVRGLPADHRSDIFSFGAVLYEMLTGRRAFPGDSQADALSAILRDEPPRASESNREVPAELDALGRRCLRKRPEERFQTAHELADALEAVLPALERPAARRQRSVAVLPFRDLSEDPEAAHLGLGLADATITELAHRRSLVVRPTSAVIRYQGQPTDSQQAGRELGVDAVVEGSFQRTGAHLRITVRLLDASDGGSLWAGKLDSSLEDIFKMQDEVSQSIARALEVELAPSDERRLARGQEKRPSAEVYELYLKGNLHLMRGTLSDLVAGVDWFEKARETDPGYALAWAGLANAYWRIGFSFQPEGDWYARAQAACEKSLSLDPSLPESRHVRALLRWSPQAGFDHAGAIRDLIAAIQGRPSLEDAYRRLASVLYHVGLLEEAEEELERALALNPDSPFARQYVGFCRSQQGRDAEALEILEDATRRVPEPGSLYQTAACQLRLGRLEDATRTAEVLSLHSPGDVRAHPLLGMIAALRGDAAEALKQVDLTVRHKKAFGHYHHAQHDVACIHALLGRKDEALAWLTDAAHNGYPCAAFFERDELLASLRGDERFERLMAELREESDRYRRLYRELRYRKKDSTPALPDSLEQHRARPAPRAQGHRPDLPPRFAAAIDRSLSRDPAARFPSAEALAEAGGGLRASPVAPPVVRRLQRAFQLVRVLAPAFAVVVAWIVLIAPDGAGPVGLVLGAVWGMSMLALLSQARQVRRAGLTADDVAAAFDLDARQLDDEATGGRLLALTQRPAVTGAAGLVGVASLVIALELRRLGLGSPFWRVALASFATLLLAFAVPVALGSPRRALMWSRLWAGSFGRAWLALAGVGLPRQDVAATPATEPTQTKTIDP